MLTPRAAGGTRPESPKTRCLSSSEITGSQVQEYEYLQSIVNLHGEIRIEEKPDLGTVIFGDRSRYVPWSVGFERD